MGGHLPSTCPHCSKVFATYQRMALHMKVVHDVLDPVHKLVNSVFCPVCLLYFHNRVRLLNHLKYRSPLLPVAVSEHVTSVRDFLIAARAKKKRVVIFISICIIVCLVCLCVCLFACLLACWLVCCLFVCLFVCLLACVFVCLFVCVLVWLSVCLGDILV